MKQLTVAIDFDDTIVSERYPVIGRLRRGAKEYINKLYEDGHYIIIWTCRSGHHEVEAEDFLYQRGIHFHSLNRNQPEKILKYGMLDCRKVSADIYVDDKNLGGIPTWEEIYNQITEIANK